MHVPQDLKWNSHINIPSKANRTRFSVTQLKNQLEHSQENKRPTNPLSVPSLNTVIQYGVQNVFKNKKEGDKTSHRIVHQLEMAQRRAARWVTGMYHNTSSISDMLRSLDWRSLEQR